MGTVMRPDQLSGLLQSVSDDFEVSRNPSNPYPEGSVYFKHGKLNVCCGACEWGIMDEVTRIEKDPINPYKKSYQRRSWPHVLRNVCGNMEIPREVRRRVFVAAEKAGYRGFLDPEKPKQRGMWLEMKGL